VVHAAAARFGQEVAPANTGSTFPSSSQTTDRLVFPNNVGKVHPLSNIPHRVWRPLQRQAGPVDAVGAPLFNFHPLRHFSRRRCGSSSASSPDADGGVDHAKRRLSVWIKVSPLHGGRGSWRTAPSIAVRPAPREVVPGSLPAADVALVLRMAGGMPRRGWI
jgi:hypothetical protein